MTRKMPSKLILRQSVSYYAFTQIIQLYIQVEIFKILCYFYVTKQTNKSECQPYILKNQNILLFIFCLENKKNTK